MGKNSGDYIHITVHKYSNDVCANIHDVDMNTNVCAHACVNAHTHTHIHVCVDAHAYIMNGIVNRRNSQICFQGHVCVDAHVFRDSHDWWDQ